MTDRDCPHGRQVGKCADCDVERLEAENEALKTLMIAAAEEISAHWDAHCDADGYGPANLMHRLEKGIPSQYGYTAGDFAQLGQALARAIERNNELEAELAEQARLNGMGSEREARLKAVNAELVESNRAMLRHCLQVMQEEADAYLAWHSDTNATLLAEIEKLEGYLNDKE